MHAEIRHPMGRSIFVGDGYSVKLNVLTGINLAKDLPYQEKRIDHIANLHDAPDIMSDLSTIKVSNPLWKTILKNGLPAATLPIYSMSRKGNILDDQELIDICIEQVEGGVGLLTIHPTPSMTLLELANKRLVPWTSRGGGLVIQDLVRRQANENIYQRILPDLISLAKKHSTTISLGASFRSSNIFDSMDAVQQSEINQQILLAEDLSSQGINVIIESPGHAKPIDIILCSSKFAAAGFPVMPLGPIPTDTAIGQDHISAAIGATIMGMHGAAHILAVVTREEHTGGVPTLESTIEGLRASRVAARVIDIHRLGNVEADWAVASARAERQTCIVDQVTPGCSRCATYCPLVSHLST